ncbi:MAG: SRPBCC family protein [Acidobacteriaceae bacterium]
MSKPAHTPVQDRIEKSVELRAPIARVWRALTDYREFGAWFRVALDGPFTAGEDAHGKITHPGYEHLTFHAVVQDIDPPSYFAFTWHPYAVDVAVDYSKETPTLVEFRLQPTADGTRLTVTESGFSDLPDDRRQEAFARNSEGWSMQMKNVEDYLAHQP